MIVLHAYEGPKFLIEWYYDDKGNSQSFEYYSKLSNSQKRKLFILFKRIADFGKINDKTKFRYEGDDIFAFKPQPDRFMSFFVKDKRIIVTSAFHKKSQKLPKNEKKRAIKCKTDYFKRLKKVIIMNNKRKQNKKMTTFEKFIQNPIEKDKFDKEYNKFLLSEFLLEAMEESHISVRKLAEKSGISPSIIQNIRSEKTSNVTFNTLISLASSLGYRLSFEKVDVGHK